MGTSSVSIPVTIDVDDVTIERNGSNQIAVKDDGITTAKIADADITTAKLATDVEKIKLIETMTASASSTITSATLATGKRYLVKYVFTHSTTAQLEMQFNSIGGTAYNQYRIRNDGTILVSANRANISLGYGSTGYGLRSFGQFEFYSTAVGGSNNTQRVLMDGVMTDNAGNHYRQTYAIIVSSENFTSITFAPSTGTITGTAIILEVQGL